MNLKSTLQIGLSLGLVLLAGAQAKATSLDFSQCVHCVDVNFNGNNIKETLRMKSFGLKDNDKAILFDYDQNQLFLVKIDSSKDQISILNSYQTSAGRGGVTNRLKSGGTPPGVHKIYKKQGENFEIGQTFDASKYGYRETVLIPTQDYSDWKSDFVLTRILRLQGLEGEKNNNSVVRSILIHGSPEEGLLGYHHSAGCIRMRGDELVDLFNLVKEGTLVNVASIKGIPQFVSSKKLVPYDETKNPRLVR